MITKGRIITVRRAIVAAIVLAAIMAVAGVLCLRRREAPRHIDVDRSVYPVRGLDLSAHNGVPDFDAIVAAGIDFVYLKASEGTSYRDPAFMRNYLAATRAGLAVGAYHFFRFDCDGASQADNFIAATIGCHLALPPAIDVEQWGNPAGYDTGIIAERLRRMSAIVSARRGDILLYTNKNGVPRFVDAAGSPDLWICSFSMPPVQRQWRLWQHSHRGAVDGVKGIVDLNTFNGDRQQWRQWLDSLEMNRLRNTQ